MRILECIVLLALSLDGVTTGAQMIDTTAITPPRVESRNDDQITLKSGRVLQGVKVIRTTPFKLVLEVIPTVEPLEIPARQVVSITYGERRPEPAREAEPEPSVSPEDTSQVLQAVKISPDLIKKLSVPREGERIDFKRQDLLNALRSVGILFGVSVTFGPGLENRPLEERIVSLSLADGATFEDFIRNSLAQEVPWVTVEYRFDTVHFDRP